jgi:cytochrome c-type biogenesis protein CcmE
MQKRAAVIAGLGAVVALAAALVLFALRDQIVFFHSPSEVQERTVAVGQPIRLGGLVKEGSWTRDGEINDFVVTDGRADIAVRYVGILPDLFREGQGVVAEGALGSDGVFVAREVLAKHDESYMPPEVAEALKKSGQWRPEGEAEAGAETGKDSAQ